MTNQRENFIISFVQKFIINLFIFVRQTDIVMNYKTLRMDYQLQS